MGFGNKLYASGHINRTWFVRSEVPPLGKGNLLVVQMNTQLVLSVTGEQCFPNPSIISILPWVNWNIHVRPWTHHRTTLLPEIFIAKLFHLEYRWNTVHVTTEITLPITIIELLFFCLVLPLCVCIVAFGLCLTRFVDSVSVFCKELCNQDGIYV